MLDTQLQEQELTDHRSTLADEQRAVDHAYTCYERRFQTNRETFRPSQAATVGIWRS
ncbi:hypothetical protein GCM10022254_72180 [Actinomadura meridiana]|uniref:Uncharacterized protein n=1 Tax=Actinomadura meridiana TaxID=559626 RepID=A0ABP8CPN2_9ACTN